MKKFSKINESVNLNVDKLETLLNQIEGITYKIYHDYYFSPKEKKKFVSTTNKFYKNIDGAKKGDKLSKLVIIEPNLDYTYINIEGWNSSPLDFNSSLFYEIKDIKDIQEKYNKIFELLKEFKENDPRIIFKDQKILLFFIEKEITDYEINLAEEIIKAKELLHKLLSREVDYVEATYWSQSNSLTLSFDDNVEDDIIARFIKTIEIQKQNRKGFEWMKEYDELEEITDIRDQINELGLYINLIPSRNTGNNFTVELDTF